MWITIFILLVYLSLIGHEMGHLVSMQKRGVKILEFSIGVPRLGPRISYVPKTGRYAGIRFSFYVFTCLLGGFVEEGEEFHRLSYRDRALIACAGPFVNIQFGCVLLLLSFLLFPPHFYDFYHSEWAWGATRWAVFLWHFVWSQPYVWIPLVAMPVCWFGRRFVSAYLAPIFGVLLLIWVYQTITAIGVMNYIASLQGPVGVSIGLSGEATNLASAMWLSGIVSISLGALNLLPIPPMDGGLLVLPAVERISPRLAQAYKIAGLSLIVFLLSAAVAQDVILLVANVIGAFV
ncbi:MAG: site-2 protease family protein [Parcubacteria group bacterium]|nr:site-2 protease family protein [Parcubacteria group bacterium]